MEKRELGNSGIQVSAVALGCWPLGGGEGWGDLAESEAFATIHAALDHGINLFDTAEGYNEGNSERVLGRALVGRRVGDEVELVTPQGVREQVVVAVA